MRNPIRPTLHAIYPTLMAFTIPFTVYLLTLAPTVYHLDSAELTTAAATLGLMRSTGYPLYILLGRLWAWLPIGDMGYRLNLFSAFNGALTIALVERILARLKIDPWARLGALGLLAFSAFFWLLSLTAEVYTLHTVFMAAIIWALLAWGRQKTPWHLLLIALLVGLSCSNHIATVLLIPGCVWYLVITDHRKVLKPKSIFFGLLGFLAGISVYLYLPLRYGTAPIYNYAGQYDALGVFHPVNLQTWEGFWWLVSGQRFGNFMFAYQGAELWNELQQFGSHLWRAFLIVGLGPGLLGAIVSVWRDWRFGGTVLLMFAGHAFFYINYGVPDKELMFLPNYLIWALWIAIGYQWFFEFIAPVSQKKETDASQPWGIWLIRGLLACSVIFALAWNWSLIDLSDDWSARQQGEAIFAQVEPDALIIGHWDIIPALHYLQLVEGQRPDAILISRFLISEEDLSKLVAKEVLIRPVYTDILPENLALDIKTEKAGPLFHLLWQDQH